jgi:hypothetical protein
LRQIVLQRSGNGSRRRRYLVKSPSNASLELEGRHGNTIGDSPALQLFHSLLGETTVEAESVLITFATTIQTEQCNSFATKDMIDTMVSMDTSLITSAAKSSVVTVVNPMSVGGVLIEENAIHIQAMPSTLINPKLEKDVIPLVHAPTILRFVNTFEDAITLDSDSDEEVVTEELDAIPIVVHGEVEGSSGEERKVSAKDFLDIQLSLLQSKKCGRDVSLLQENLYLRQVARSHGIIVPPRFHFSPSGTKPLIPSQQATTSMDSAPFTDGNVPVEDIIMEMQVCPHYSACKLYYIMQYLYAYLLILVYL